MTPPPRSRILNYSSRGYGENSSYENISSVCIETNNGTNKGTKKNTL